MALCEKILIAGFSGAGKTSLIRALKSDSPEDWDYFDDLDQLILKNQGKGHSNLASLIEKAGWEKFRLWERQILEGWLKEEGKGVLALGGGTLSPLVWDLFSKQRKIRFCYLKTPFETCWSRLVEHKSEPRPLAEGGKSQLEAIFNERKKIFDQIPWRLDGKKSLLELKSEFWKAVDL